MGYEKKSICIPHGNISWSTYTGKMLSYWLELSEPHIENKEVKRLKKNFVICTSFSYTLYNDMHK